MSDKVDFKKTLDSYRVRRGQFRVVDIPTMNYLMIDGHGDPNTSIEYSRALEALYPVAYKMKFASKRDLRRDYVVPPLEGLWWADDMDAFTSARDKTQWKWTMMIMVPEWIDHTMFATAVAEAGSQRTPDRLSDVRLESLTEGLCVQTLHVGSFDNEAEVLDRMHNKYLPAEGLKMAGTHHEVYFSDPRRTAPEKLRTLLRQPVASQK